MTDLTKKQKYYRDWAKKNRAYLAVYKAQWGKDNPRDRLDEQRARLEKKAGRPRPEFCECCGGPETAKGKVINFDHNHRTGAFRGWLCSSCNKILGLAKDDPTRLMKLATYLMLS